MKLNTATLEERAFTLVEVAIVLVIIGLVAVGAIAGKDMIEQAQLNSVQTDINKYISASRSFELEYGYMPGDAKNAFDYFGAACDADADKCNGDGNKVLNAWGDGPAPAPTDIDANEISRFWQHLSLAKLVSETYLGTGYPAYPNMSPKVDYKDAGIQVNWGLWYMAPPTRNRAVFTVGARNNTNYNAPIFTPMDAYEIDTKFDDGQPDSGNITTHYGSWATTNMPNCKQGPEPDSVYKTDYQGDACALIFTW